MQCFPRLRPPEKKERRTGTKKNSRQINFSSRKRSWEKAICWAIGHAPLGLRRPSLFWSAAVPTGRCQFFFCVCLLQLAVGSCCTRKKDIKLRPPAEASGSHLLCTLPVFLRPPVGQQLLRFNAIGFLFWLFRVFQQLLDPNIFQTTRNRFFWPPIGDIWQSADTRSISHEPPPLLLSSPSFQKRQSWAAKNSLVSPDRSIAVHLAWCLSPVHQTNISIKFRSKFIHSFPICLQFQWNFPSAVDESHDFPE